MSTPTGLGVSPRRVAKNTASQVVAYGLSWGTKAALGVAVARMLGPRALGDFSLGWTVASMLAFFAPLGLTALLVRELNRRPDPRETERALPLACLLGLAFGAAMALFPHLAGARPELTGVFAAGGVFVALSPPVLILRAAFHGKERMEYETATVGVEGFVSLLAAGLALYLGFGIVGAMLGLAFGQLANLLLSVSLYRRLWGPLHPSLEFRSWSKLLRMSFSMGIAYAFSTALLRLDIVLLGALRPAKEVGLYSAAAVIVMALPMVANSLAASLYPALSRATGADDPDLRRVFAAAWKMLFVAGIVAAAGLAVLASEIIDLLYGSEFAASTWILAALAVVLPLRFVNGLAGWALNALDRPGRRMVAVGLAATVNVAANLTLIPLYGYRGAVYSTIASEILLTVLFLWGLRPMRAPVASGLLEGLVLGAVVAGTAAVLPGPVVVRGLSGTVLYLLLAVLLWRSAGRSRPSQSPTAEPLGVAS